MGSLVLAATALRLHVQKLMARLLVVVIVLVLESGHAARTTGFRAIYEDQVVRVTTCAGACA